MGVRGPVPKRSNERAGHRAKADKPEQVAISGRVSIPTAAREWHPKARSWYLANRKSGQSRYWEPSDWQTAWVLADMLSRLLKAERPSPEMFKAWLSGSQELGTTEGSRRRMRIEVQRLVEEKPEDGARVAVMERYRNALG